MLFDNNTHEPGAAEQQQNTIYAFAQLPHGDHNNKMVALAICDEREGSIKHIYVYMLLLMMVMVVVSFYDSTCSQLRCSFLAAASIRSFGWKKSHITMMMMLITNECVCMCVLNMLHAWCCCC